MAPKLGGAMKCFACEKSVYFNDQKSFQSNVWHQACFKCASCAKRLESGTANVSPTGDGLVCNGCNRKFIRQNSTSTNTSVTTSVNRDDIECCPRCGKKVYYAEQVLAQGRKYHKACFSCSSCNKKVDSTSATDHDGQLYCKSCHGRKFGPKGYGFASGAGTMLSMDDGSQDNTPINTAPSTQPFNGYSDTSNPECCPRCGKRVYFAEQILALSRKWHKSCFNCGSCGKKVDSTSATDHDGNLYCRPCHGKQFGPKGYGFAGGAGTMLSMEGGSQVKSRSASVNSNPEPINHDDIECCPKCGKRVYFAEQILSLGRKYHKSCFSCSSCGKKVDSTSATDHDGNLYCRPCHGKQFGPKGYGFAGGAGTMLSMEGGSQVKSRSASVNSNPEPINHDDIECCPKCGKRVYFAEQILSLGRKYHKPCFSCSACNKQLDSTSATDHDGQLFCKSCHGRKFGPKGYGFAAGAGTMLSMDDGETMTITRSDLPYTESQQLEFQ